MSHVTFSHPLSFVIKLQYFVWGIYTELSSLPFHFLSLPSEWTLVRLGSFNDDSHSISHSRRVGLRSIWTKDGVVRSISPLSVSHTQGPWGPGHRRSLWAWLAFHLPFSRSSISRTEITRPVTSIYYLIHSLGDIRLLIGERESDGEFVRMRVCICVCLFVLLYRCRIFIWPNSISQIIVR